MDLALQLTNVDNPHYGDIQIVNGDILTVTGKPEILQLILQTLSVYLGEWFMDLTIGLPFFQEILVSHPDQAKIDAIFLNAIINCAGVTQINAYSFSVNTRTRLLTVAFNVTTTSGIVNYQGLVST